MSIDNYLNQLKNIKKVEAPPFLFTRIQERIKPKINKAPTTWKWAFVLTSFAILMLNVVIIKNELKTDNNSSIIKVVESMQLSNSNNFYNE